MTLILGTRAADGKSALARYLAIHEKARDRNVAESALANAAELRRTDALIQEVFERSFDGILIIAEGGRIEVANQAVTQLFGYRRGELLGRNVAELVADVRLESAAGAGEARYRETVGRRRGGAGFPVEVGIGSIPLGGDNRFVVILRDITDRKEQQSRLEHQAAHDALTGLPNRLLLGRRLEQFLDEAQRRQQPLSLLMLDLDRFKEVNDALGHHVGDMLLCDVARRLASTVRANDTIARLGGDEFAALLGPGSGLERAVRVAERMLQVLTQPFSYEDVLIEVGASIGIAQFPDHATERDRLLQCADVAMYAAKQNQLGHAVYRQEEDPYTVRQLVLASDLRRAIAGRQIHFEYQPKLDLASGRVIGVEALARWQHPVYGRVSPGEFILQAERLGVTHDLTLLTLDSALHDLGAWRRGGHDFGIAINLSARELHNEALPRLLRDSVDRWSIDPGQVTIEITESAIMRDTVRALEIARHISSLGVKLSIDDFGTGYSSLAYLSQLPVSELKIDKSFVLEMNKRQTDATIVQSTVDLAHNLGLKVVAEGVETDDTLQGLSELGCDVCQGFLIGSPMPDPQFIDWLGGNHVRAVVQVLERLRRGRSNAA
jgi:diguanylate cyclase (GGDEF)-like protein/PAS domain S-box-containing protein